MTPEKMQELQTLMWLARDPYSRLEKRVAWNKAMDIIDAELALHSTAEIAGTRAEEVCRWTHDFDDYGDVYQTQCGRDWCFEVEGPKENNVDFCMGCGKRVEVRS